MRKDRQAVPACMRGALTVSLAYADGYKAGRMGLPRDVAPEPYSALERRAWQDGWGSGRKVFK